MTAPVNGWTWFSYSVTIGLIGLLCWWQVRRERQRRDTLAQVALRLGLRFAARDSAFTPNHFAPVALFQHGSGIINNILHGSFAGRELVACDYRYTVGSGKHRRTFQQTVALYHCADRELPVFQLQPEHLLQKLGALVGYHDLDFNQYPEFSRHYWLRGKEVDAVRQLFSHDVLRYLQQHHGWSVEGGGSWLAVYRRDWRVPPEELRTFLDQATTIAQRAR